MLRMGSLFATKIMDDVFDYIMNDVFVRLNYGLKYGFWKFLCQMSLFRKRLIGRESLLGTDCFENIKHTTNKAREKMGWYFLPVQHQSDRGFRLLKKK